MSAKTVENYWSSIVSHEPLSWHEDTDCIDFRYKLTMIFNYVDQLNKVKYKNRSKENVGIPKRPKIVETSKIGETSAGDDGYVVDNNFTIKSIGDSFHDMFDSQRSKLNRNIDTFQEILLARFVGSFQADDNDSNWNLLYKLLQIYKECRKKIIFYDRENNKNNVDGNKIAELIFNTPLVEDYIPNQVLYINSQFQFKGDIIDFQPNFKHQRYIIANILLSYFHKRANSDKINIFLYDIMNNTLGNFQFIDDSFKHNYSEIITSLTSLYEAESIIPILFDLVRYFHPTRNQQDFIKFLKDNAVLHYRLENGYLVDSLPSVNSSFSYIFNRGRNDISMDTYPHTCNIKQIDQASDFSYINDNNTNLLTGRGDIVIVADFDKRSTFINNVAKNQNRVILSKTASCELDEAPDSFSKTILELNRNTNTTSMFSSSFETDRDDVIFKTKDNKKLYTYRVVNGSNDVSVNGLINNILDIYNEAYNDTAVGKLIGFLKKLNDIYFKLNKISLYQLIVQRIPEASQQPFKIYQYKVEGFIRSSNNLKNYIGIIHKVVKDEFSQCRLEITLHNTPFTFINDATQISLSKISVNNMSSQIKSFLEANTIEDRVEIYIKNLLEIDARLRGKASGDILPTLSTLPIVKQFNSDLSGSITSTIVTSGDQNAILNLLLLAKLNPDVFDKVIILTSNTVDGNQNEVAIRIGDNSDIFNEYNHGKLDSLLTYHHLQNILKSNITLLKEDDYSLYDSLLGYFWNKNEKSKVITTFETPHSPEITQDVQQLRDFINNAVSTRDKVYSVMNDLARNYITSMTELVEAVKNNNLPIEMDYRDREQIISHVNEMIQMQNQMQNNEPKVGNETKSRKKPVNAKGIITRSRAKGNISHSRKLDPSEQIQSFLSELTETQTNREKPSSIFRRPRLKGKGGSKSHKPKVTRRKTTKSPKRKTIKKRKMPKRKNKTRRNK